MRSVTTFMLWGFTRVMAPDEPTDYTTPGGDNVEQQCLEHPRGSGHSVAHGPAGLQPSGQRVQASGGGDIMREESSADVLGLPHVAEPLDSEGKEQQGRHSHPPVERHRGRHHPHTCLSLEEGRKACSLHPATP